MALPLSNSFEGGTSGSTITAGSSGGVSGNAFDVITGSPTWDNTRDYAGALSMKTATAAASSCNWTTSWTAGATIFGRCYIYETAIPSAAFLFARGLRASTVVWKVSFGTGGKLSVQINTGTTVSSTTTIALNQWNRIEFKISATGTSGTLDAKLFANPDDTTATESIQATTGGVAGDTTCDEFRFGNNVALTNSAWIADVQCNNTGYPGPWRKGTSHSVSQAVNRVTTNA